MEDYPANRGNDLIAAFPSADKYSRPKQPASTKFQRQQSLTVKLGKMRKSSFMNYMAHEDNIGRPRLGHLDIDKSKITPLSASSGAPFRS